MLPSRKVAKATAAAAATATAARRPGSAPPTKPTSHAPPKAAAGHGGGMSAAMAAAAARPHGGTHGLSSNQTHAMSLPTHTPLSSVLSQFRESEATWAHEKVCVCICKGNACKLLFRCFI